MLLQTLSIFFSLSPYLSLPFPLPPPPSLTPHTKWLTMSAHVLSWKRRDRGVSVPQTVRILKQIHLGTYEKGIPYSGFKFQDPPASTSQGHRNVLFYSLCLIHTILCSLQLWGLNSYWLAHPFLFFYSYEAPLHILNFFRHMSEKLWTLYFFKYDTGWKAANLC